jgi:hypothetical protein
MVNQHLNELCNTSASKLIKPMVWYWIINDANLYVIETTGDLILSPQLFRRVITASPRNS